MNRHRFLTISALLTCIFLTGNYASSGVRPNSMAPSMYETFYFVVNTASPPLDNVLARYALTMATDRQAIVSAMREEGFKYLPSIGLAPPYEGYEPLKQ